MVFTTLIRWLPRTANTTTNISRGPMRFWRIQQNLRFAWRFRNRARNCYQIGARYVNKALSYSMIGRQLKKKEMRILWDQRIEAASEEHGLGQKTFLEGLARSHIQLDRKVLTDLAIYEPRTFQSLCEVSKATLHEESLTNLPLPNRRAP